MNNSLITFWNKITDLILPKEERVRQLETLGPDGLFDKIPRSDNFDFETSKIKAIFNYKTALCRQAIWEIKYRANKKLIRDFSLLLYEYILEDLSDLETFNNFKKPFLVPIPSSREREKEKGFNQCKLIVRELIKIDQERKGDNFRLLENFLIKKVDTPHQTKVSNRKKRLENLRGSFSVSSHQSLGETLVTISYKKAPPKAFRAISGALSEESFGRGLNSCFILIDDVITTGATMNEAFRALNSAGYNPQKIRGYALAH
jgi:predicted amidophosphoribosyltransferase